MKEYVKMKKIIKNFTEKNIVIFNNDDTLKSIFNKTKFKTLHMGSNLLTTPFLSKTIPYITKPKWF